MMSNKNYLSHHGEFAKLKNFICGHYYQTVWEDFEEDKDIWKDYSTKASQNDLRQLKEQIEIILKWPDSKIFQFLSEINELGGLYFEEIHEAIEWLNEFNNFLKEEIASKK